MMPVSRPFHGLAVPLSRRGFFTGPVDCLMLRIIVRRPNAPTLHPDRSFDMRILFAIAVMFAPTAHAQAPDPFPLFGVTPGMTLQAALEALEAAGLEPDHETYEISTAKGETVEVTDIFVGDIPEDGAEGFFFLAQVSPENIGGQVVSIQYQIASKEPPGIDEMIAARDAVYGPGHRMEVFAKDTTTWHVSTSGDLFDVFDYRCATGNVHDFVMAEEGMEIFDQDCAISHTLTLENGNDIYTLREYLEMPAFAYAESREFEASLK
jgi:hypothetical protein